MKNLIAISSILLAFAVAVNGEGKLQIGIKKRVENCTVKTRKGDLVHIHYTVNIIHWLSFIDRINLYIHYQLFREHLKMVPNLIVAFHAANHSHSLWAVDK